MVAVINPILLSYPIPSHPIPSHPIPSHPIPSHHILSYPIPSHPIPSHPIPCHPILPILSCPILSYPILSYPILSCPVLSCPTLSYHIAYSILLKTSYGILRILNFDWFTSSGIWAHLPLTTKKLEERVFFEMAFVISFEVFLWMFLIKQLFYAGLLDMR